MSKRADYAEIVLECHGCGDRTPVASIHLDHEGDPVVTTTADGRDRIEYSFVRELGTIPALPHVPQKATLTCDRGHEIQINLPPLVAELKTMPPRRVRRAV